MMTKFLSFLKDTVVTLIIAVAIAFLLKYFVIDSCKVLSSSMYPTLQINDRILVFKLAYLFGEPQRGDIIVFEPPDELDQGIDYIKRLIGLPGDTIEVKDNALYINGEVQTESYVAELPLYDFGPVTVPEGEYLVLGDNRNLSMDSHEWNYPFITFDDIEAKAILTYFPFGRFDILQN